MPPIMTKAQLTASHVAQGTDDVGSSGRMPVMELEDFVRSGNQSVDPVLYDVENAAIDREHVLWAALREQAAWDGRVLLDLGCGSGFWLPRYDQAAEVIGVEPDEDLLDLARARPGSASVLHGSAEHLPLADATVDVVHARYAYFFPHREFDPTPGLTEVARVLKTGGRLVVIDNDTERGEFAELLKASPWAASQGQDTYALDWWGGKGARSTPVMTSWQFDTRADLEAVLHLEFPTNLADRWLEAHPDRTGLTYASLLHTWTKH